MALIKFKTYKTRISMTVPNHLKHIQKLTKKNVQANAVS